MEDLRRRLSTCLGVDKSGPGVQRVHGSEVGLRNRVIPGHSGRARVAPGVCILPDTVRLHVS